MEIDTSGPARRRSGTAAVVLGLAALTTPLAFAGSPASAVPAPAASEGTATLPTFEVAAAGLSPAQAERLGKALGVRQIDRAEDGSVRFAAEGRFLAVPTRKARGGVDEDGNPTTTEQLDMAALKKMRPVAASKALAQVRKALAAAKLVPAGGRATAGNTTLQTVDTRGRTTASVAVDTTVSYSFTLAGLPLLGPGAKVRVALDGKRAVTGLSYSTRSLVPGEPVAVLDATGGLRRCAQALGENVRVRTATPAYYAPALSVDLKTLEPSFRCTGVAGDGSEAQAVFVPAAVDARLPEMPPPPPTRPTTPAPGVIGRAYQRVDVGSEGTGPCSGLPNTGLNLASFNNRFAARGIPVEFSWLNQNAWERDFKDPSKGGNDSNYADHVDMTYWQGHGSPTGFSFSGCSTQDDAKLSNTDALWGNGDVEWMSLFTCLILEGTSGGQAWWQRWGPAFAGLHQINSFHTVSYHSSDHGSRYADYLLRSNPMRVRNAWAWASIDDQPSDVVWASMGAIGPGGSSNINDYFWGRGSVGADIPAASITGYWYLRGNS